MKFRISKLSFKNWYGLYSLTLSDCVFYKQDELSSADLSISFNSVWIPWFLQFSAHSVFMFCSTAMFLQCFFSFSFILRVQGIKVCQPIIVDYANFCHIKALSIRLFLVKDCLPHLLHGFRNKYVNKISLDTMLYFHSCISFEKVHGFSTNMQWKITFRKIANYVYPIRQFRSRPRFFKFTMIGC